MATHASPSTSQLLERLAARLHNLAFDFAEPSRSIQRYERMVDDGERIADEVRAAVRGCSAEPPVPIDRIVVRGNIVAR